MSILNYSVYCKSSSRSLLSWRIASVSPPDATFRSFFNTSVVDKLHTTRELHSTFVGSIKDKLDLVDSNLKITDVTTVFGPFVKFLVENISPIPPTGSCML